MHRHTIIGVGGPLSVGGLVIGHRRRLARPSLQLSASFLFMRRAPPMTTMS